MLRLGVRTGHPRFFNQISCGLDLVSMAGEWLTATANTNMWVTVAIGNLGARKEGKRWKIEHVRIGFCLRLRIT